jgi:hypothetical protein
MDLPGLEHAPPLDRKLTLYQSAMEAIQICFPRFYLKTPALFYFRGFLSIFLALPGLEHAPPPDWKLALYQ